MAARDPYGFRPLAIGQLDQGYVFASETCAFDQTGAVYVRDVLPGELVVADEKGIHSTMFRESVVGWLGQCIFEHVYFARPDSFVFGQNVQEVRVNLGRRLSAENPVEADVVVPIPDSGNDAALGFSQVSGIQIAYGFIRNHYIGRTFIMPDVAKRADGVDLKLAVVAGAVRGKRVVVVDDSIVRGTTCRRRVALLRQAGAKEVHLRIACPPIRHPCYFGIDFPSTDELVASRHSLREIQTTVEADSLAYLSLDGMLAAVHSPEDYCTGCFTGQYPVEPPRACSKEMLEPTQDKDREKCLLQ